MTRFDKNADNITDKSAAKTAVSMPWRTIGASVVVASGALTTMAAIVAPQGMTITYAAIGGVVGVFVSGLAISLGFQLANGIRWASRELKKRRPTNLEL